MDKTYLIDLVRDVPPRWDQRDKNYHKRCPAKTSGSSRREIKRYRQVL